MTNEGTTFRYISNRDGIPSNFQIDFIRNSLNKDTLYQCLAERFTDLHSPATQILAVTYKNANLKTQDAPDEGINWCKYEEADAHVIRHLISVSRCQMFDTILLLFIHMIQMFCYFVWLIIIIVRSKVQHVLFSVRLT